MSIKIDLRVPPCKPMPQVADFVKQCEDAGFSGVGILDSQLLERDCFVAMAGCGECHRPHQRRLGGHQPGDPGTRRWWRRRPRRWVNWPRGGCRSGSAAATAPPPPSASRPPPCGRMRHSVVQMKELMSGDMVNFGKANSRMRHGGEAPPPPVYIAATGPRVMKVTGEVADGCAADDWHPPRRRGRGPRDRGRRSSGRRPQSGRHRDHLHRYHHHQGRPQGGPRDRPPPGRRAPDGGDLPPLAQGCGH